MWYVKYFKVSELLCNIFIGTGLKIDNEFLSSLEKDKNKKKKINNNSEHVTPFKLGKYFKIYTAYLILRRTHWDPNQNKFVPESEILFCSNAFTPGKL